MKQQYDRTNQPTVVKQGKSTLAGKFFKGMSKGFKLR